MVVLPPGRNKLNIIKMALKGLNYRLIGTGIRFTVPLYIIALSTEYELGLYYLSLSILLTASSFLGLEMGYFFSTKYLSKDIINKKDILNQLIINCTNISLLVTIPIVLVYAILAKAHLPLYIFLVPLLFTLEACSFELGRFFWNIGEVSQASFRDFIKSIFFIVAIYASLQITDSILSIYSVTILIISNICIIFYEILKWGDYKKLFKNFFILKNTSIIEVYSFIRLLISACGPQFVQNQVIGLTMLIEKIFITSLLGLSAQGIYSFIYSLMQTSAALFLMPSAAKTKQTIIADHPYFNDPKIYLAAIRYLPIVILFLSIFAVISFFAVPILADIMEKSIDKNILIVIFAVFFSASSNAFMSSVAPLYSHPGRWVRANIISILLMLPLLVVFIFNNMINLDLIYCVYFAITISAFGQAAARIYFFTKSFYKLL